MDLTMTHSKLTFSNHPWKFPHKTPFHVGIRIWAYTLHNKYRLKYRKISEGIKELEKKKNHLSSWVRVLIFIF